MGEEIIYNSKPSLVPMTKKKQCSVSPFSKISVWYPSWIPRKVEAIKDDFGWMVRYVNWQLHGLHWQTVTLTQKISECPNGREIVSRHVQKPFCQLQQHLRQAVQYLPPQRLSNRTKKRYQNQCQRNPIAKP